MRHGNARAYAQPQEDQHSAARHHRAPGRQRRGPEGRHLRRRQEGGPDGLQGAPHGCEARPHLRGAAVHWHQRQRGHRDGRPRRLRRGRAAQGVLRARAERGRAGRHHRERPGERAALGERVGRDIRPVRRCGGGDHREPRRAASRRERAERADAEGRGLPRERGKPARHEREGTPDRRNRARRGREEASHGGKRPRDRGVAAEDGLASRHSCGKRRGLERRRGGKASPCR